MCLDIAMKGEGGRVSLCEMVKEEWVVCTMGGQQREVGLRLRKGMGSQVTTGGDCK